MVICGIVAFWCGRRLCCDGVGCDGMVWNRNGDGNGAGRDGLLCLGTGSYHVNRIALVFGVSCLTRVSCHFTS